MSISHLSSLTGHDGGTKADLILPSRCGEILVQPSSPFQIDSWRCCRARGRDDPADVLYPSMSRLRRPEMDNHRLWWISSEFHRAYGRTCLAYQGALRARLHSESV